ncbi:hypothetical protein RhiirC2_754556 [Rhizophagus irregularis]|uniref:TLDc domain-containing protein n=1 Tax=Rhizophagus irregularis TaxID=588596 RepID=A0A2N1MVV1_9GLOM|nr:hypothetical protein RhiirC2_754556 [Rhizophagus irregularis]
MQLVQLDNLLTLGLLIRIINTTNVALLASWIDKKRGNPYNFSDLPFEFKLIHRASRDGFGNDKFHNNCDNKGPTIVVIKVKYSGEIIGVRMALC